MNEYTLASSEQATAKFLLKANSLDERSFQAKLAAISEDYKQKLNIAVSSAARVVPAGSPSAVTGTSYYGQWLLFLRTSAQGYIDAYTSAKLAGLDTRAQDVRTSLYSALSALPDEYADMTWRRITQIGWEATQPKGGPRQRTSGTGIVAWPEGADMDPNPVDGRTAGSDPQILWATGYVGYIQVYEMALADGGNKAVQDKLIARLQGIGDEQAVASLTARFGRGAIVDEATAQKAVALALPLGAALFFTQ